MITEKYKYLEKLQTKKLQILPVFNLRGKINKSKYVLRNTIQSIKGKY